MSTYPTLPKHRKLAAFKGRILIACDERIVAKQISAIFEKSNLRYETADDFNSACKLLKSKKFDVVYATPRISGGSWRKLLEFGRDRCPGPTFVVVARSFDLTDWADCLKCGAFEVLDSVSEISRAAEVAADALSVALTIASQLTKPVNGLELQSAVNA